MFRKTAKNQNNSEISGNFKTITVFVLEGFG